MPGQRMTRHNHKLTLLNNGHHHYFQYIFTSSQVHNSPLLAFLFLLNVSSEYDHKIQDRTSNHPPLPKKSQERKKERKKTGKFTNCHPSFHLALLYICL